MSRIDEIRNRAELKRTRLMAERSSGVVWTQFKIESLIKLCDMVLELCDVAEEEGKMERMVG